MPVEKQSCNQKQIEIEAESVLKNVDVEEICEAVFSALDSIEVEDLWDRSGPGRHGYIGPEEMAVEMMNDELEFFKNELVSYFEMGMTKEAKLYCMGVLKGIYRYEEDRSEQNDRRNLGIL